MEVTKKYWKTYKYAPHKDNKRWDEREKLLKENVDWNLGKENFTGEIWRVVSTLRPRVNNARAPPYDAYKTKTNTYFYGCRRYCVSRDWKVC